MKKALYVMVVLMAGGIMGCGHSVHTDSETEGPPAVQIEKKEPEVQVKKEKKMGPGTYAVLEIGHKSEKLGEIVIKLYEDETPLTAGNFIDLAEGKREFIDPETGETVKREFYDGLVFHRVIPNFMIQGGDPLGSGRGGPGYRFADEIVPQLKFDRPGLLAMANAGPNTNGSQFFITVAETPWLNGKHTIFGEVVEGMDTVMGISQIACGAADRPLEPVVMQKVTIKRISQ